MVFIRWCLAVCTLRYVRFMFKYQTPITVNLFVRIFLCYMLWISGIVNSFNWKRGCYGSSCIVCSVLVCKIHVCFIAVKEFHVQKVSDRNVKKTLSKYLCFWNIDRFCTRTSIRNGVLCSVCKMISRLSNTPSDIEMDMNICVESLKRSSLLRVIRMLYEWNFPQ